MGLQDLGKKGRKERGRDGGRKDTEHPVRFEYDINMNQILPSNITWDILKNYSLFLWNSV